MGKRYVCRDYSEACYIMDTEGLKGLDHFIDEIKEEYLEDGFTLEEIKEIAEENYYEYLEDNSMDCDEITKRLNDLNNENEQLNIQLENIGISETNDKIKKVDGRAYMRY